MKKEFKIISELIENNTRVLDVPDFLKSVKNFLEANY